VTESSRPTLRELLADVVDLSAGAVAVLLPFFILAVPCAVLVIVPLIAAAAVVAVVAAVVCLPLLPPYLLVRALRRRSAAISGPRASRM
jgi:hypothetical protein